MCFHKRIVMHTSVLYTDVSLYVIYYVLCENDLRKLLKAADMNEVRKLLKW